MSDMRRREFITLLGGAAAAWPLAARAQQGERMRRIGVLMTLRRRRSGMTDPPRGVPAGAAAIGLDRRPQRADRHRWAAGNADDIRRYAAELVALAPDVILAQAPRGCRAVAAGDPHRADRVRDRRRSGRRRLCRQPGAAGRQRHRFIQFEYSMSGKWLELLKQIAPGVTRAAVLRDPASTVRDSASSAHPGRGAVARGGGEPGQCARRRRDRARHRGIRAQLEWRPDRDGERGGGGSSRSDHRAGGPAQAARGLLSTASSSPPAA